VTPQVEREWDRGLARCEALLDQHLTAAVARFGAAALGVIDLPPLGQGRLEPPQIRVAAALYWCREVEVAGLPGFLEALADGLFRGRITLPLGAAGDRIMQYYREREERFSADERRALYQRVLGEGADAVDAMLDRLTALVETIAELPILESTSHVTSRVQVAAREIAQNLSDRAVGVAAFAARDVVAHVRQTLDLLADPELVRALGGGSPWTLVERNAPAVMGQTVDPATHLALAQAGQRVLAWLADVAPVLAGGALSIGRTDAVVQAAEAWRAAGGRN